MSLSTTILLAYAVISVVMMLAVVGHLLFRRSKEDWMAGAVAGDDHRKVARLLTRQGDTARNLDVAQVAYLGALAHMKQAEELDRAGLASEE